MSIQKLILTLSTLGFVMTPNAVHAQGADPLSVYVQAGIGPAQHAQITDLAAQLEETNSARSHEIVQLLRTLKALSLQPDLDEKQIIGTQNKINQLQDAMAIDRLKLNIKVRKILTAEQRSKLVAILREQRAASNNNNNNSASAQPAQ